MSTKLFTCCLTDIAPVVLAFAEHINGMVGVAGRTVDGRVVFTVHDSIVRSVMRIDAMPYESDLIVHSHGGMASVVTGEVVLNIVYDSFDGVTVIP